MNKKAKAQRVAGTPKTKRATSKAREDRHRALRTARKDPLFLADIEEVERDFAHADAEAARMIDELT